MEAGYIPHYRLMNYSQLRDRAGKLLVILDNNLSHSSGNITRALNDFNKACVEDKLAEVMMYQGIGSQGIETEEKYRQVLATQLPLTVELAYRKFEREVIQEFIGDSGLLITLDEIWSNLYGKSTA